MRTKAPKVDTGMKRPGRDPIGVVGRVAEIRTAKRLNGQQTPGSGNMVTAKGDIRRPGWLIENKATVNDSYAVSLQSLAKCHQEALRIGKSPALAFQFVDGRGEPRRYGAWICIPEYLFREIEQMYAERYD